ncbi:MAG: hypothetical protein JWO89_425 [Verrucomicrobiaceae bacterium]|nr:hypothetical protein [Verrucomicrobiaceae bacterium]MDB6119906.1 hypothetical protein [Verrucomicrobiaceae bacterium]
MAMNKNLGMLLLAVYLIVSGAAALLGIGGLGMVLAILAVAAGVLLLMGK